MKNKPVVQTPTVVQKPQYAVSSAPVQKQEEPAEATPPKPTPLEACITEKMGQGMSEEEATNTCKAELEGEKEPPPTDEKSKGLVNDFKNMLLEMRRDMKTMVRKESKLAVIEAVKAIREEATTEVRKGLFGDDDPRISLSDIEGMVRKILLEKEPHGKRTLTETGDKPVKGAEITKAKTIVKPAADLYKDLTKNRGTI